MSEKKLVVGDIVIPLDNYPKLNENQSLQEAIQTFMSFRAGQQDRLRYAGLLVVNDKNQLVGKLSLVNIMHGLVPRLVDATNVEKFEGKEVEYPNLAFLYEDSTFGDCKKHQAKPIKPLMEDISLSFSSDTHILKALAMMTHRDEYNVPVTKDGIIIGILCLEEIFNTMCKTYCEL